MVEILFHILEFMVFVINHTKGTIASFAAHQYSTVAKIATSIDILYLFNKKKVLRQSKMNLNVISQLDEEPNNQLRLVTFWVLAVYVGAMRPFGEIPYKQEYSPTQSCKKK